MLPNKCIQPACINMDGKMVAKSPAGLARKRLGTNAQRWIKLSPLLSSTRKNRTLAAIRAYVTMGVSLRSRSSSPIGNIGILLYEINTRTDPPFVGYNVPYEDLLLRIRGLHSFLSHLDEHL